MWLIVGCQANSRLRQSRSMLKVEIAFYLGFSTPSHSRSQSNRPNSNRAVHAQSASCLICLPRVPGSGKGCLRENHHEVDGLGQVENPLPRTPGERFLRAPDRKVPPRV